MSGVIADKFGANLKQYLTSHSEALEQENICLTE